MREEEGTKGREAGRKARKRIGREEEGLRGNWRERKEEEGKVR